MSKRPTIAELQETIKNHQRSQAELTNRIAELEKENQELRQGLVRLSDRLQLVANLYKNSVDYLEGKTLH
jgi:septal ring factor EnvC (AmiA/AmiB activator)